MKLQIAYSVDNDFYDFVKIIPELRKRLLAFTSSKAKGILIAEFLSGQEIRLAAEKDSKGRRTVAYRKANRVGSVYKLSSYTLNLFDRGRRLRSGRMEPGKMVLTQKLPARLNSRIDSILREFEALI